MKISYCITVCNEFVEFENLLIRLNECVRPEDEILVQIDSSYEDSSYVPVVAKIADHHGIDKIYRYPLNSNFAAFKNNLFDKATGDYIFQLDADELPSYELIETLPYILEQNKNVDLFYVPRINIVNGITDDYIKNWNWNINEENWINWPDYQSRIYRNCDFVRWQNPVHETIIGAATYSLLPAESGFALWHEKSLNKQVTQNKKYDEINNQNKIN